MQRRLLMISFGAALLLAACDDKAEGGAKPVATGAAAPEVSLVLHDGKTVTLSSLKGHMVLLYFYPKDDTPG